MLFSTVRRMSAWAMPDPRVSQSFRAFQGAHLSLPKVLRTTEARGPRSPIRGFREPCPGVSPPSLGTRSRQMRNTSSSIRTRPAKFTLLALAAALVIAMSPSAWGAVQQEAVVLENPANYTPSLVDTGAGYKPIVDAIAQSGGTVFVGGRFERLTQGGQTFNRTNLAAFSATTGAMADFDTELNPNGRVWALASIGDWVYAGGEFTAIGGTNKRSIVRVNANTGAGRSRLHVGGPWPGQRPGARQRDALRRGKLWSEARRAEPADRCQHEHLQPRDHRPAARLLGQRDDPRDGDQPGRHQAGRDRQLQAGRGSG